MELDDLDAMKDISGTYRDTYTYEGKTYAFVDDAWIGGVNVGIAISANATNPAAAKAFMNFLAEDETMLLYQQLTGNFMVKDVGYEVDEVAGSKPPFRR